MQERHSQLDALTRAVAAREWHRLEGLIRAAYETGATREELLGAVEAARTVGDVSGPVVAHAYATVHNWRWMMARRQSGRPDPVQLSLERQAVLVEMQHGQVRPEPGIR